ncbi:hypothetical protein N7451_008988 [Penicillium sp. IBT 35674x]|nr:hypothetical protein N7451_008988 [Penicillium sp. IBT 35674x]
MASASSSSASAFSNFYYIQIPILKVYLNQLVFESREDRVDHLWSNVLRYHFPLSEGFGLERETYTAEDALRRINIVVTNVLSGAINKTLFVECKRPAILTEGIWDDPESQLQSYMREWTARPAKKAMYGMVCIGYNVIFYEMPADQNTLRPIDFPKLGTKPVSIRTHPESVRTRLNLVKEMI